MADTIVLPATDFVRAPTLDDYCDPADGRIRIACDTEFCGPHTLTAQFAARLGPDIVVQVYRSLLVPEPPPLDLGPVTGRLRQTNVGILFRPVREFTPHLSPVQVLGDLFGLPDIHPLELSSGSELTGVHSPIRLELIAHYWPADFFRLFGRNFFDDLLRARLEGKTKLCIQSHKLLGFRDAGRRYHDPILEYAMLGFGFGSGCHPVEVRTMDTVLPFGTGRLEDLGRTFAGVGKLDLLADEEKRDMMATFQVRPEAAYLYALWDPILTLLVAEGMRAADRRIYAELGFSGNETPAFRPTLGSRVAETMVKTISRHAEGSVRLSQRGKPLKSGAIGKVSASKVKRLMAQGGGDHLRGSKFGTQTGETHGGLLFSRSPDRFFHNAPGHLRDVDLSGCYARILAGLSLYAGRPVVHEPGSGGMTLRQAVAEMEKNAAGRDGWVIKVSGRISKHPNVLIPSTRDALTNGNHASRAARHRARQRRYGFVLDGLLAGRQKPGNTAIYMDVIEAGVVCWATWLMIQALPPDWRREYEDLEVDTILFYPRRLVARNGLEYDRLAAELERPGTSWASTLDLDRLEQVTVERLDAEYVSLQFPIGEQARQIQAFREAARLQNGPGSAAEKAWKQHANSMYGVTASRYLPTNNVVLANVITATARALAFAMSQALNAIQTITDGSTYRRDQIPAGVFADSLAAVPDYPVHRAEAGVQFIDPRAIPDDDAGFTEWYRGHVMRFFGVAGPDYEALFSVHPMEHKRSGPADSPAFDALCCDGSSNNVKLIQADGRWQVMDHKARSYKAEAKAALAPWIVATYSQDCYAGPPPITESTTLMGYKEAAQTARKALRVLGREDSSDTPPGVLFPLGMERRRVQAYRVIKSSAFVFRTPDQREKICKQLDKFFNGCGCGLEVLTLRQSRKGRRQGSIEDLGRFLYRFIRSDADNLTKALNLTRTFPDLERVRSEHAGELNRRKAAAQRDLHSRIDARRLDEHALLTGLVVRAEYEILASGE